MRRAHGADLAERPAPEADVVARPEPLRTEFPFELPRGYVDGSGNVHRSGVMRLATGAESFAFAPTSERPLSWARFFVTWN